MSKETSKRGVLISIKDSKNISFDGVKYKGEADFFHLANSTGISIKNALQMGNGATIVAEAVDGLFVSQLQVNLPADVKAELVEHLRNKDAAGFKKKIWEYATKVQPEKIEQWISLGQKILDVAK